MTPQQLDRYRTKAATAAAAWQQVLGEAPRRHALILAMAVADLETGLGHVKGHNWGSVHKRTLSAAESSVLLGHGVYPTGDDALASARGLLAPTQAADEVLVIDKNAVGPYFVWLWAFTSDLDAAKKFLATLILNRAEVRAIIDSASPTSLSAAMYATHYYEGTSKDPTENIRAYAALIETCVARIESALLGWPPVNPGGDASGNPSATEDPRGSSGSPVGEGPANGRAPEKRGGGMWSEIAGIAALGLGVAFLGRRA